MASVLGTLGKISGLGIAKSLFELLGCATDVYDEGTVWVTLPRPCDDDDGKCDVGIVVLPVCKIGFPLRVGRPPFGMLLRPELNPGTLLRLPGTEVTTPEIDATPLVKSDFELLLRVLWLDGWSNGGTERPLVIGPWDVWPESSGDDCPMVDGISCCSRLSIFRLFRLTSCGIDDSFLCRL